MSKKVTSRKEIEIDGEWVKQTRAEIFPYTENSLYEHGHFLNVERHIKELALERHLDENIALFIAYFHDVSRVKEGVYGKRHSKMSSEMAKAFLEQKSVTKRTQKIICTAIERHNQKSKIQNFYDELIKDADALAHQDEFGLDMDNDFEKIRIELMNLPEMYFLVDQTQTQMIESIYAQYSTRLIELMSTPQSDINYWVHEVRTSIRKIEALLYFSENRKLKKEMLLALKKVFKIFEKSRALYVIYESIEVFNAWKALRDHVLIELGLENEKLIEYMHIHYSADSIKQLKDQLICNEEYLKFSDSQFLKLVKRYIKCLKLTDLNDIHSLHKLRIEGKRLKYILGSGLITMTQPTFQETLLALHDLLGNLNDIHDRNIYYSSYEMSLEERGILNEQMALQKKLLKKEIKKRLFLLKKMIVLNKIIL